MSKTKLEIKLHGNQRVLTQSTVHNLTAVDKNESMCALSEEHINLFCSSVKKLLSTNTIGITNFIGTCFRSYLDEKTIKLVKKPDVNQPQPYTCHGKLRELGREGLNLFFNHIKLPDYTKEKRDSEWILSLFEEDSPFVDVTKDVTFVVDNEETFLIGFIFRNVANLDIHVFTNLLIWTRTITEFKKGSVLTKLQLYGMSKRQAMSFGPVISEETSNGTLRFSHAGSDHPVYFYNPVGYQQDYPVGNLYAANLSKTYWPYNFASEVFTGKGLLVSDVGASWNPCNYVSCTKKAKYLKEQFVSADTSDIWSHVPKRVREMGQKDFVNLLIQHIKTGEQIIVK